MSAVDPADVMAQARAELGLSRELAQPRRVEPHPRRGGSSGYPVWSREEQLKKWNAGGYGARLGGPKSNAPNPSLRLKNRTLFLDAYFFFRYVPKLFGGRTQYIMGRLSKCGHLEDMTSPVASLILSL